MKKITLAVLVLLAVIALFVALTWPRPGGNTVILEYLSFHPGTLTVNVGTTVTWTDRDPFTTHDVIGGSWASGALKRGDSYSYTFTQPGTYEYRCSHHSWMKGRVVVR